MRKTNFLVLGISKIQPKARDITPFVLRIHGKSEPLSNTVETRTSMRADGIIPVSNPWSDMS